MFNEPSHPHSSLPPGVSPFYALFGRQPIMIPEMEDPSLYRATYSGPDFLKNVISELRDAWDCVRNASEEI